MIAIRLLNRWLTMETGRVGDDNEPEIETEDKKEKVAENPIKIVGFGSVNPYDE